MAAVGRLIRFTMTLLTCMHVLACGWANMGKADNSWVAVKEGLLGTKSDSTLYLASLYWTSTVFATVGYGDLMGFTTTDYVITIFVFVFY